MVAPCCLNQQIDLIFSTSKKRIRSNGCSGILPEYNGTVVHDGWGSYNKYECAHALCNAHLKRELTGIEENFEQQWAKEINGLLSEVKKYTDECKEMEIPIDPEKVREFEEIYDAIIQEGIEEIHRLIIMKIRRKREERRHKLKRRISLIGS